MRATTYLSLLFAAIAGTAGAAAACANGGSTDDTYDAGGDDGGSGDATGGDVTSPMGDGGTQGADSAARDVFTCTPMGPPSDCTMAMNLGALTPGQMMSATGNIATTGGQAYVAVTFTGNVTPSYHPQIALTEGGTEFAFDVLSDCTGTTLLTCADEDAALDDAGTGTSTWEEFYADAAFTSDAFIPIPPSGNDGGVVVRIYRRAGMPLSCNQYALTVTE